MKRIFWFCLAFVMAAMLSACSGKKGVSIKSYPGIGDDTGRKLVVLLPTIGGKGEDYNEEGFIEELRTRGGGADIPALDVTPSLYLGKRIVEVLKAEVIAPAKHKGYEAIYLADTSLGGHGALLYATAYPPLGLIPQMIKFAKGTTVAYRLQNGLNLPGLHLIISLTYCSPARRVL